jgi:hypothetical protein
MSVTGLEVFDPTVSKRAYLALRSTLHALRDRLPVEEVAQSRTSRRRCLPKSARCGPRRLALK